MWDAWNDFNIPSSSESGNGNKIGRCWIPSSQDPRSSTRSDAKTGHYDSIKSRSNYKLLTGYKVRKINFSNTLQAVSVTIYPSNDSSDLSSFSVQATKEVVLAAGAIHTPQLLQLSGIGSNATLQKANIKTLIDLPGVGSNFQDHPAFPPYYNCKSLSIQIV